MLPSTAVIRSLWSGALLVVVVLVGAAGCKANDDLQPRPLPPSAQTSAPSATDTTRLRQPGNCLRCDGGSVRGAVVEVVAIDGTWWRVRDRGPHHACGSDTDECWLNDPFERCEVLEPGFCQ